MRGRLIHLVLYSLTVCFVYAQSTNREFDVASVKLNRSGNGVIGGCRGTNSKSGSDVQATIPLGRCRITAGRLSHLIAIAYRIRIQNLKGGPDWVWGTDRFDIDAKADNPSASEEQLLIMLQNLLADRFSLKFHRETKEVSGQALVVARNGPKLKEATGEGKGSLKITGASIFKPDFIEQKNPDQNTILGERLSMSQLANTFANLPDVGPVIDRTGLNGFYDFKLAWEPGESLSSVLQQQLGLKLEAERVPIEVLVIDSAEKPTAN